MYQPGDGEILYKLLAQNDLLPAGMYYVKWELLIEATQKRWEKIAELYDNKLREE